MAAAPVFELLFTSLKVDAAATVDGIRAVTPVSGPSAASYPYSDLFWELNGICAANVCCSPPCRDTAVGSLGVVDLDFPPVVMAAVPLATSRRFPRVGILDAAATFRAGFFIQFPFWERLLHWRHMDIGST